MPEIHDIRRSIRAEKLREREAIVKSTRDENSKTIAQQVERLAREWSTVHCYLAFRSEVDTYELIGNLLGSGKAVIVPWVEEDGRLTHHKLSSLDELSEGTFGIPHPPRNEFVDLQTIEVVLIPLAAFDRHGNRLGYGKGFYDRFLSTLPQGCRRVGLAFAAQEAESIPAMDHDQKLDMIVTELEIIHTTR